MEQSVDLRRLIDTSNRSNFQKLIEKGSDSSFSRKFSQELANFVILSSSDIPPVSTQEIVEREGSFGILPPPARMAVVKAMLKGERIPPLKVHDETMNVGDPERLLDKVSLHAIMQIDPRTAANHEEQEAIVNTLFSIGQIALLKDYSFRGKTPTGAYVSVKSKEIQAVLHLIKKGVVGNYKYEELPINLPEDIQKAFASFQQGLSWVLDFHPNDTPKSNTLTYEILDSQIKKAVEKDKDERKISLPIFVLPKHPSFIPTSMPLLSVSPGNNSHMQLLK